ncbi:hypothetical protein EXIGLDRAFT_775534 [Exidia glandulosa HHB12029]|uniref:Uncharacterized protein n=1 Tax=Exidia glandulosa HHB12029 TaxID=1314781 RepID=A0A165DVU3_EXIGL|nr:hypothetical protein EXIGLDRAFT_775534 [Exidia glandulosa HHB12029]
MSNTARHAPTIESLATETMQHILLFAFSPFTLPKGTTDYALMKRYAWFASMARISRSWPAAVYPLLYKSVVLLTNRAASRFLRTLRHEPTLRAVVRVLVLPGWTGVDLEIHKTWSGPRQSVYRDIARLCTDVRTLAVGNAYRETVLSSKAPWINDIKDLRINIMTITGDCTVPRLPSLRILRLYGPNKALLTSVRVDFGPVGNLESLHLRSMVFGRTHYEAVLSLCTSLTTLMCTRVLVRTLPTGPPVFVSPSEWTLPLRRTLTTLSLSGCSPVRTLRELKMLTTLYVDIAALPTASGMEGGAWLPESLVEVTITTAASQNLQMKVASLFSPWDYARRAWEVIQSDSTRLPRLRTIRLQVDVYRESSIRTFTLCSFVLRQLAQDRDRAFEMNLNIKFYRDGDSFDWPWPKFERPPRPSPLRRLSALLKGKNRQLFRISSSRDTEH